MLAWRAAHQHLGANLVEEPIHVTCDWTLRFIVITLVINPLPPAGWNPGREDKILAILTYHSWLAGLGITPIAAISDARVAVIRQ